MIIYCCDAESNRLLIFCCKRKKNLLRSARLKSAYFNLKTTPPRTASRARRIRHADGNSWAVQPDSSTLSTPTPSEPERGGLDRGAAVSSSTSSMSRFALWLPSALRCLNMPLHGSRWDRKTLTSKRSVEDKSPQDDNVKPSPCTAA